MNALCVHEMESGIESDNTREMLGKSPKENHNSNYHHFTRKSWADIYNSIEKSQKPRYFGAAFQILRLIACFLVIDDED